MREQSQKSIFSIGHSNHTIEKFLSLLNAHSITALVDVRSNPYSKYASQFNSSALKAAVIKAGIKYLYLGKELGGIPKDDTFYDDDGNVDYGKLAQSPLFIEGIDRLEGGAADYRIAIMCAEENPIRCHRRLLIAPELENRSIKVVSIRGDGRLETESDQTRQVEQPALFET